MRRALAASCLLVCSVLAQPVAVAADVCVVFDTQRDKLPKADRAAARLFLVQALKRNGQNVVETGCTGTFTVYHLKLGRGFSVQLEGPNNGHAEGRAKSLEEIPDVYSELVKSLLAAKPPGGAQGTPEAGDTKTSEEESARAPVQALWYGRVGYGSVTSVKIAGGPAAGFGFRYEPGTFGLDASIVNFIFAFGGGHENSGFTGSFVKLVGLWFIDGSAKRSAYLGGGLGFGRASVTEEDERYSSIGLQGELSVGYEFLRRSTMRIFLQLDATLPFHESTWSYSSSNISMAASTWVPSLALSFGLGFGQSSGAAAAEKEAPLIGPVAPPASPPSPK